MRKRLEGLLGIEGMEPPDGAGELGAAAIAAGLPATTEESELATATLDAGTSRHVVADEPCASDVEVPAFEVPGGDTRDAAAAGATILEADADEGAPFEALGSGARSGAEAVFDGRFKPRLPDDRGVVDGED